MNLRNDRRRAGVNVMNACLIHLVALVCQPAAKTTLDKPATLVERHSREKADSCLPHGFIYLFISGLDK